MLAVLLVWASAAWAAVDMVEWARTAHLKLRAEGHVLAEVEVAAAAGAESPGSAEYDFKAGRCRVHLDREKAGEHYSTSLGLRFMVYHELAHCHLFANPREIEPLPALGPVANRLLSDAVHLDYAGWVAGRLNGYLVYHETYADVKAFALLLREGETSQTLEPILTMRKHPRGLMYDPHASFGVFGEVFGTHWAGLTAEELDARARAITDRHILVNYFLSAFGKVNIAYTPVSDLVNSAARGPVADLVYDRGEVRQAVAERHALLEGAPQPSWRLLLELVGETRDPDAVARQYFLRRYGKTRQELGAEDEAIRAALLALRQG